MPVDFSPVATAFHQHFGRQDEFCEQGAALVVYQHGEKVLDLCGGTLDDERVWTKSTLVNVWSASKAVMAVAIAQLVQRKELDYHKAVCHWWPEFAQNGKSSILLEQVMSHRSGLNGFAEPTSAADLYQWQLITERLARQAPLWIPDSTASYHGMTYGWLCGELIRRVTGLMPADYIRQYIAQPLGLDLHLGLPAARRHDAATLLAPMPDQHPIELNAIARHCVQNPVPDALAANSSDWQQAQLPSVNVHCTAAALAGFYAALLPQRPAGQPALLSEIALQQMLQPRGKAWDEMLGARQWAAGVALNTQPLYGPNAVAYGHSGWGGSFGCADPATGLAVGYVTRRMGNALNGDPRAKNIINSLYQQLAADRTAALQHRLI